MTMAGNALLITTSALFMVVILFIPSLTLGQNNPELILMTGDQFEITGSIFLQCRDAATAEPLELDQIKFWVNRTSYCDPDLATRADMRVMRVGNRINFNLTRNLEGFYTCGRLLIQENEISIEESTPKPLISLQTVHPVSRSELTTTTFTARVGDTAILPCPTPPGALIQYYSVRWMKDDITIITADSPQAITQVDPKFDVDTTYSLVIHSVNLNDSSSNYRCELSVTNPLTNTKRVVQPDHEIPNLVLNIMIDEEAVTISRSTLKPASVIVRSPMEQPSFTCIANRPNITWISTNSRGEETNLIADRGTNQISVSSVSQTTNRGSTTTTKSTITLLELNLATDDSLLVRCRVSNSSGITTAESDGFFIITADYSLPHNETTRCHHKEHALVIGLTIASLSIFVHVTLIILVLSIRLIVKSQYRR